jgi:hypothetical protein
MKKYRKFAITAAILLALVWWAALELDVFSTFFLCLVTFIFFFASFILAAVKLIAKKEIKYNLIIMGASMLLTFSLILPPFVSNQGHLELTAKRKVIMQELRPVFIQYRRVNGTYPSALENLVPGYILEIPAELVNNSRNDSYEKIFYALNEEGEPLFIFHKVRGPYSAVTYNIHEDKFFYDQ